mmetsp:Transcript_15655/g.49504  ORF Transcript_15655/g.49504 Transcript_15655/m.49504 type:complete len:207 (-) Transcript_15655:805-1425(-)
MASWSCRAPLMRRRPSGSCRTHCSAGRSSTCARTGIPSDVGALQRPAVLPHSRGPCARPGLARSPWDQRPAVRRQGARPWRRQCRSQPAATRQRTARRGRQQQLLPHALQQRGAAGLSLLGSLRLRWPRLCLGRRQPVRQLFLRMLRAQQLGVRGVPSLAAQLLGAQLRGSPLATLPPKLHFQRRRQRPAVVQAGLEAGLLCAEAR